MKFINYVFLKSIHNRMVLKNTLQKNSVVNYEFVFKSWSVFHAYKKIIYRHLLC